MAFYEMLHHNLQLLDGVAVVHPPFRPVYLYVEGEYAVLSLPRRTHRANNQHRLVVLQRQPVGQLREQFLDDSEELVYVVVGEEDGLVVTFSALEENCRNDVLADFEPVKPALRVHLEPAHYLAALLVHYQNQVVQNVYQAGKDPVSASPVSRRELFLEFSMGLNDVPELFI